MPRITRKRNVDEVDGHKSEDGRSDHPLSAPSYDGKGRDEQDHHRECVYRGPHMSGGLTMARQDSFHENQTQEVHPE